MYSTHASPYSWDTKQIRFSRPNGTCISSVLQLMPMTHSSKKHHWKSDARKTDAVYPTYFFAIQPISQKNPFTSVITVTFMKVHVDNMFYCEICCKWKICYFLYALTCFHFNSVYITNDWTFCIMAVCLEICVTVGKLVKKILLTISGGQNTTKQTCIKIRVA